MSKVLMIADRRLKIPGYSEDIEFFQYNSKRSLGFVPDAVVHISGAIPKKVFLRTKGVSKWVNPPSYSSLAMHSQAIVSLIFDGFEFLPLNSEDSFENYLISVVIGDRVFNVYSDYTLNDKFGINRSRVLINTNRRLGLGIARYEFWYCPKSPHRLFIKDFTPTINDWNEFVDNRYMLSRALSRLVKSRAFIPE